MKECLEEILNQYQISHKGIAQCKCISGAKGHLLVKLLELFELASSEPPMPDPRNAGQSPTVDLSNPVEKGGKIE